MRFVIPSSLWLVTPSLSSKCFPSVLFLPNSHYIMYTVSYYLVTPGNVRTGKAMSKSPKEAFAKAQTAAYDACVGCESIGVEGWTMWRDSNVIAKFCDLD